jgi:hypothetical protein
VAYTCGYCLGTSYIIDCLDVRTCFSSVLNCKKCVFRKFGWQLGFQKSLNLAALYCDVPKCCIFI